MRLGRRPEGCRSAVAVTRSATGSLTRTAECADEHRAIVLRGSRFVSCIYAVTCPYLCVSLTATYSHMPCPHVPLSLHVSLV